MTTRHIVGALLGLFAIGPFALLACEDSSTGGGGVTVPPSPTATTTATTPAPTTTTPGPTDAGTDGDAGVGEIPHARTLKLANLTTAPAINACFRKDGTTDAFVGPLFRVGGIPVNAVSARVIITLPGNGGGNAEVKVITEGAGCESTALSTGTLTLATQAEDVHLGISYGPGASQWSAFFEHLTPTPGKESVLTQVLTDPRFTRDDAVGSPINLRVSFGSPVLIDPGLVGKISVLGFAGLERPMKTVAGGTLSLWSTPDAIILCDDRAPAVNGLSTCPTTLRAP